jgi:hypothetical protein
MREYRCQSFWDGVRVGTEDACWEWQRCVDSNGYGMYRGDRTHRWAFLAANFYLPKDGDIRHLCGNRKCANPNHLAHGTRMENARDAVRHGSFKDMSRFRKKCGEHHRAVLANSEVVYMRDMFERGFKIVDIARQTGRKYTTVWAAVKGPNFSSLEANAEVA